MGNFHHGFSFLLDVAFVLERTKVTRILHVHNIELFQFQFCMIHHIY